MFRTGAVVQSEAAAAADSFHGCHIFEQVRRPTVGARRCSPAATSFVAVERVIHEGQVGVLLRRAYDCWAGPVLAEDLTHPSLLRVGIDLRTVITEDDGTLCVVFAGCPGVRLRALAERCFSERVRLADEVVWHLIRRTSQLANVWTRVGVEPGDTLIGFDGSLHLFPRLSRCELQEAPSLLGNEVFDTFLLSSTPESLSELMCGWLPRSWSETMASRVLPHEGDELAFPLPSQRSTPPLVEKFLERAVSESDGRGPIADLVRRMFPETYARHQRVYDDLHVELEREGLERELRILAGG
jgi:hypothetical protein